jgi:hypothetical protein
MKKKYRVVSDMFAGYEVQTRIWWLPFWRQHGYTNTHRTIEDAIEYIKKIKESGKVHYETY